MKLQEWFEQRLKELKDDPEFQHEMKLLEQDEEIKKPPLGLMPNDLHKEHRFYKVCAVISRYYNAGMKIPIVWVEEYNELVEEGVVLNNTSTRNIPKCRANRTLDGTFIASDGSIEGHDADI